MSSKNTLSSRITQNLVAYAFVPMVVIFELSFHFERLISRGGQFFPALGRQLGVDWDFLMVSMSPWWIKFHQIAFILVGVFASRAVLKKNLRLHEDSLKLRLSFRHQWSILLLAGAYIYLL